MRGWRSVRIQENLFADRALSSPMSLLVESNLFQVEKSELENTVAQAVEYPSFKSLPKFTRLRITLSLWAPGAKV